MMPPPLAQWAHAADIATLPSGLGVAVRQFLSRAPGLSPQSRHLLGLELLHATLPHVSPPPPGGYHPEVVLCAVVAERRRRDTDRLWREEQLRARVLPADPSPPRTPDPFSLPPPRATYTRCRRAGVAELYVIRRSRGGEGQWAAPRAA